LFFNCATLLILTLSSRQGIQRRKIMKLKRLVAVFFMIISLSAFSQNYEINNELVTACGGAFLDDSGGAGDAPGTSGADYTITSYTYTICPDSPGDVISVDFALFNVYQSPNPNNSDYLAVFDGDNTGDNTLGSYTGTALQGLSITGTVNNTSGCLTFVFNPSGTSPGTFAGWEAIISCTTPCANPTSASTISDPIPDLENSVSVCLNQPITFEDAGSSAAVGFTLENYIWNFDDGTIVEGEQNVEYAFSEPGEYIVTLTVEDNNGCQNLNLVPLQVLVSTIPVFNTDFSSEVCLGGEGYVNGSPIQSQTWTALPPQVVAGETYLPDDAGQSYLSALVFDFFEEDQTLDDCSDLLNLTLNMEHSYMGDLQIQINCPSGNTVVLVEFGDGGGGTFLGEALDDGGLDPGIGYDYNWDPDATNGNWGDNSAGVDILPEGTYESSYDMCGLVGCELNGEWSLEIIDNIGLDNGYIFEWGLNFNPEIMPGITTFTPDIGLGLDSTWVEGPFITNTSSDGNFLDIMPPSLGAYEYVFSAANNFGCTFDTTIVVEVVNGPQITLPEELGFCGSEFDLVPEIVNDFDQGPCNYIFTLGNENGNSFDDSQVELYIDGVLSQTLTTFNVEQEFEVPLNTGAEISLGYVFSFWGEVAGNFVTITNDAGVEIFNSGSGLAEGEIFNDVIYCSGPGQIQYSWSPIDGLDNPNAPSTFGNNIVPTTYTLSAIPEGHPGCEATASIYVFPQIIPDLGEDAGITICASSGPFSMFQQLEGTPDEVGTWINPAGDAVDDVFDPSSDTEGVYTYLWEGQDCPSLETELEIILDLLELTLSNDTSICQNGIASLEAYFSGNAGSDVNVVWNSGLYNGTNIEVQPLVNPTVYQAQAFYGDNCVTNTDEIIVTTLQPLQMSDFLDEVICLGDSVVVSAQNESGGLEPYTFTWTSVSTSVVGESVVLEPIQTTTYCLEMTDVCESTPIETCFDIQLNEVISPFFIGDNLVGCSPVTTNFTGTAADLSIVNSVVWEFGDGATSNSINQASHTYVEPGVYDVNLTITGTDGCVYESSQQNLVNTYNVPNAEFTADELTLVLPNSNFVFENLSSFNDYNYWTFDTYGTSIEENPEFTFPVDVPGEFEIELVAQSNQGCSDTVSYSVYLNNGFSLFAPSSFTPDGDGVNEVWKVEGVDIDEANFRMAVFSREGEVIFQSFDPTHFWDGSHMSGSHYVPNGVYSYQIITRAKTSGDKQKLYGHITLLR
jgi:gliding motility-associated-like protein